MFEWYVLTEFNAVWEMQEKPFFIYHTLKIQKLPGLCPGPRWRSSRRSPRPPSRVGRAPLPTPLPLSAFGASLSGKRLQRLFNIHKRTPPFLKSWIRPCTCALVCRDCSRFWKRYWDIDSNISLMYRDTNIDINYVGFLYRFLPSLA